MALNNVKVYRAYTNEGAVMRAVSRRISSRSAAIKGEYFNQGF